MGLLYGRAGRLNAKNGGFRPGQELGVESRKKVTRVTPGTEPPELMPIGHANVSMTFTPDVKDAAVFGGAVGEACLDEGLLYYASPVSFVWRIPICKANDRDG
jgi:hypothetical protein